MSLKNNLDSSLLILTDSFTNTSKYFNLKNFKSILFPLASLTYKEIISVLGFFWIWENEYPLWFFILYSLVGSTASFFWGWWGDKREQNKDHENKYILIIFADILITATLLLLIFNIQKWIIILLTAIIDTQSNARSTLATKKLISKHGHYHEKSLFLNKLCWTAIFLCWSLFYFIKNNQEIFIASIFLICILSFLIYTKKSLKNEKMNSNERKQKKDYINLKKKNLAHLMLISFASYEAIFFLLWSFSEGTHAPINFFALTGGACLIGNVLSFFVGTDKEVRIIKHMYFAIFVLTLVSFLVLVYFPSIKTILTMYAVIAALGGIYLPYVFDETMRIYGKDRRGEASGLVDIFSSIGDISSTILVKFLTGFVAVSIVASILALFGFFMTILAEKKIEKHLE